MRATGSSPMWGEEGSMGKGYISKVTGGMCRMYTEGVPVAPGRAAGAASQPMWNRLPDKRHFQTVACVRCLGLKATKVIRYQCGWYSVLLNATKMIMHKTIISPVPSSPLPETRETSAIFGKKEQARYTIKGKEETSYLF